MILVYYEGKFSHTLPDLIPSTFPEIAPINGPTAGFTWLAYMAAISATARFTIAILEVLFQRRDLMTIKSLVSLLVAKALYTSL